MTSKKNSTEENQVSKLNQENKKEESLGSEKGGVIEEIQKTELSDSSTLLVKLVPYISGILGVCILVLALLYIRYRTLKKRELLYK